MGKISLLLWCLAAAACGSSSPVAHDALGDTSGDVSDRDGVSSDGPPMLSCNGLASTCGPAATSSCCSSSPVPGGTFYRSYDVGTDGAYPDTAYPATLSDFRLDTYEVTVGRFRQFVSAGMGTQASPPAAGAGARTLNGVANQGGWDPAWNASLRFNTSALVAVLKCDPNAQAWTDAPGGNENLPMNCVSWLEAFAFCAWDGGFLPTEAEWNYAAAGGSEQRAYPWSSPPSSLVIDCSYANYLGTNYCVAPNGGVNRVGTESPNGDGKWGQADLGGNVQEWVLDSYSSPYANPCDDCADLTPGAPHVLRGGVFNYFASSLRGAYRFPITGGGRGKESGFRCARAP